MRFLLWFLSFTGFFLAVSRGFGDGRSSQGQEFPGPVFAIAMSRENPGSLYIETPQGLLRWKEEGHRWERIFSGGLFQKEVRTIAVDPALPGRVFLSAGSSVFVSFRGVTHWRRIIRFPVQVHCMLLLSDRLLIGTERGIQIGRVSGDSWKVVAADVPSRAVFGMACDPSSPGRCYAVSSSELLRSDDDGEHWRRIWGKSPRRQENLSEVFPDGAATQETEEEEVPRSRGLCVDPVRGVVYLGTETGVLTSRDGGENWQALPTGGLGIPFAYRLFFNSGTGVEVYAATPAGLFRFEEDKKMWQVLQLPSTGEIYAVAFKTEGESSFIWVGAEKGLFLLPLSVLSPRQVLDSPLDSWRRGEPSVREVQQAAIGYAEVMPEKIQGWRKAAAVRSWIPKFTLSLDGDRDRTVASSSSNGKTTFSVGPEDGSVSLGLDFTWDLANLIYNPDQTAIDVRSRLMVQLRQDVLEEVTRLYFERRRLLAEFEANPTQDPILQTERQLRAEALTAQLDALTGGIFSQTAEKSF